MKGKAKQESEEDDFEIRLGHSQSDPASSHSYDEELIREQLARNYAFFGKEGMVQIRRGKVAVVGCGGVGSWAAVMLVRS